LGREELLQDVKRVVESGVRRIVERRISEFKKTGRMGDEAWFKEMCFCILTANYSALRALRMWSIIGEGFITWPEERLRMALKSLGHRFPNARARYIVEARRHIRGLKERILNQPSEHAARIMLVRDVRGLGMKEASHFLRNVGFDNLAIIDFHILNLLERYGLIVRPKTLTRRRYLAIEALMRSLAEELGLTLSRLDLYLWYLETGRVLK